MKGYKTGILPIIAFIFASFSGFADEKQSADTAGSDVSAGDHAEQLYKNFCAACHGNEFRGDGPLARAVVPAPVSFVQEAGEHSFMEMMHPIMHGEGMMPAWSEVLSHDEAIMIVRYIKNTAPLYDDGESGNHSHK